MDGEKSVPVNPCKAADAGYRADNGFCGSILIIRFAEQRLIEQRGNEDDHQSGVPL
jgi:hypothetical protein